MAETKPAEKKKRGCTGWAIGALLTVALAFVGGGLLFAGLEVMALAFTRVGVAAPSLAWGLTGGTLGALIGAVVGLRRAGRKRQLPEVALAVVLVGGLAALGAGAAGGYVRPAPIPSRVLFEVVVMAEELNVRPTPSTNDDPLATVVRGQRLDVVATRPDWYAVRFERDGRLYEGWIGSAYAGRTGAGPSEEAMSEDVAPYDPPAEEGFRAVSIPPSAQVPVRLSEGRLDIQVLRGRAESAPGVKETRVTLRVEERSSDVAGSWPAWAATVRGSYLTDGRGGRYPASAAESTGLDGDVLPGRVRQGTLVVYVPLPPEAAAALTLVYASGDAPPVLLPLDGRPAPGGGQG